MRGFTDLSEGLEPEQVFATLTQYLTGMSDVIYDHQGTLDKYLGDGIMAFWGAPLRQDDHAALACRAALAMLDSQLTANIAERVHRGAMLLDERLALWSRLHLVCRAGGRLVRGVSLACTIQRCCWKEIRSESELNRVAADHLSLRWYLG